MWGGCELAKQDAHGEAALPLPWVMTTSKTPSPLASQSPQKFGKGFKAPEDHEPRQR